MRLDQPSAYQQGDTAPQASPQAVEEDARLALALRVAAHGERAHMYEGTSNDLGDWMGIEEAVRSMRAFALRVRLDVVPIDLDTAVEQAQCRPICQWLRSVGLSPVVLASGQPGRRHIFVWVPSGPLRAAVRAEVERRCGSRRPLLAVMRPPLSPHRLGLPVTLLEPASVAAALDALPAAPDAAGDRLSQTMRNLLAHGDTTGRYRGDESTIVQALLTGAVNAQWAPERAFRALLKEENVGGGKVQQIYKTKGETAARRYFDACLASAQKFVAGSPAFADRMEAVVALATHRVRAEGAEWPGREGTALRVVFLVLLDRAVTLGSKVVFMSERHLAEMSGYSRTSVSKYLVALQHQGFISCLKRSRGNTNGIEIKLNKTLVIGPPSTSLLEGCEQSGSVLSVNHDAFEHGAGLGKRGQQLLKCLDGPLTALELSERTGIPIATCRRILAKCLQYGIATKTGDAWERASDLRLVLGLGRLARASNTHRNGIHRRERHQADRRKRRGNSSEPQAVKGVRGWVDPSSGTFQNAGEGEHEPHGNGLIAAPVMSFRYGGETFSICSCTGREVLWTQDASPADRRYPFPPR